jgi:uncharacterized 2Fe-2S/4Fe-4S cluster protein (DUF4445 family)
LTDKQIQVTFQPSGRTVFVLPGTTMLEAAGRAGLTIATPCGGAGTCGKCRVQIVRGACPATPTELQRIPPDQIDAGWRLACQSRLREPAVVFTPDESLFASGQRILTETLHRGDEEILPGVRKVYVELPSPTLADAEADLPRMERQVGRVKVDIEMLRRLGPRLRAAGFRGTCVLTDHKLIDFEPGDTTGQCFGAAFDVGTTTLAATLLDLCTGKDLAVTSRMNPQVSFGDDVLSRIGYASQSHEKLSELRDTIAKAVAEMTGELVEDAGVSRENVYELAFSGNTTMEHLLCGIDVTQLGSVPFAPAHERGLMLPASQLGPAIHHGGMAYVFPVIGGFVGGDAVAGILSTGMAYADGPTLMIDIGTNGEIVLAHDGELLAASTAAGPAFEGARISCGMRAARGAIEKIVFADDVELSVIGNVEPVGICGSALVDLAAGLLGAGIVTPEGRLLPAGELPPSAAPNLRRRVSPGANGQGQFTLTDHGRTPLAVTQRDIRELQLATGAIRAGVSILLRKAGIAAGDLRRVLIAGGFGSFIRRSNAQRIGLLPAGVPRNLIRYVGNTSLSGAKWALLSTAARKEAERLAAATKHVQLSEDADFQAEFAEAMIFPEDPGRG